jgi:hypothetical protein
VCAALLAGCATTGAGRSDVQEAIARAQQSADEAKEVANAAAASKCVGDPAAQEALRIAKDAQMAAERAERAIRSCCVYK